MEMTRRNFLKSSSAAVAAAGVAGYAGAADSAKAKDEVIARTKFIDIHAHCTEFEMPPVYAKGKRPLCIAEDLVRHYDALGVAREGAGCGSVGDVPGAWLASAPLWPSLWT